MADNVEGRGAGQRPDKQLDHDVSKLHVAAPSREVAGFVDRFAKDFADAYQRQINKRLSRETDQHA